MRVGRSRGEQCERLRLSRKSSAPVALSMHDDFVNAKGAAVRQDRLVTQRDLSNADKAAISISAMFNSSALIFAVKFPNHRQHHLTEDARPKPSRR